MVKRVVHLYETSASYVLWSVPKTLPNPSSEIMLSTGNKVMLRSTEQIVILSKMCRIILPWKNHSLHMFHDDHHDVFEKGLKSQRLNIISCQHVNIPCSLEGTQNEILSQLNKAL
jgi:hypothetical protein